MHQTVLIEDLAVVLCVAAIVIVLFQKIKQPTVLGYLIAGLIVGPYTPPFSLIDDESEIRLLAELGVIFLMFSLGLEFTFDKIKRLGFPAIIIAVVEVFCMLFIGFFSGLWLGWSQYESLLLGAALSISSTTIIIKALEEFHLKRYSFAQLMVGVLLIEDLLAILLLVYVSTTGAQGSVFSWEIVITSLKLLLAISSWFLIGYFAMPFIMRRIQHYINAETLTIISIGLCLFLSAVAAYFEYSTALGAFIMGSILAETPLAHRIETLTLPIRDVFAAVFFVSVGMLIDPNLILAYWEYVLILSLITIVGKILTSGIGALIAGQSVADSIRIGFSMAQIGEFSFIIIGIGSTVKTTDDSIYPIIVAISVITTFTTPYFVHLAMRFSGAANDAIPLAWQTKLKAYREYLYKTEGEERSYQGWSGKNIIRFIINGIIVAIIAVASSQVIIQRFLPVINEQWPFQFLFWLIVFLGMSPFIWAMLFAHHPKGNRTFGKILAWIITFSELALLVSLYFTFPLLIVPIALILFGIFKLSYHNLKICYAWFEKNLINNLTKEHEIDEKMLQTLAPWDNELARIKIAGSFPYIGQRLEECHLRTSFGINIVAIKRASKTIWLPDAKERLLPEDEIVIVGEKDEIDEFSIFAQRLEESATEISVEQPNVLVQTVCLTPGHLLINKVISDPEVKNALQGLIVGLDRQGQHILNPKPSTKLNEGDVLLVIIKK